MLRKLLFVLLLLVIAVAVSAVWLRTELARIKSDTVTDSAWYEVAVAQLAGGATAEHAPCAQQYPQNKAWFGALHVHTGASYDAAAFGTLTTVDEAYRFARGEALAMRFNDDPPDVAATEHRILAPLDFMAVTDHAEALGESALCNASGSDAYDALTCRLYRGDLQLPIEEHMQSLVRLASFAIFGQQRSRRVCGEDGSRCRDQAMAVWRQNQLSTEAWNDNSADCAFTSLHGYEYTLANEAANLHRNVIFKTAVVPQAPLSAKDAGTPEQLWDWLEQVCIEGHPQCDVLAIPHNSNWSSGRMWFPYSNQALSEPERIARATLRARLEPLAEIFQVKGDSECRNGIASVQGAPDEFCNFEKLRQAEEDIPDCGETIGSGGMMLKGCTSRYNFVRYALTAGLIEQQKLKVNPFKLGIVAASDTHIGAPDVGREQGHQGSHGNDRKIQNRLLGEVKVPGDIATGSPVRYNPGGIAGIYAPENSRAALFDAMQRRETFGTSGPRIAPRFFAGWDLPADICNDPDILATAYARGVPMGGDLPAPTRSQATGSPVFVASARKDPRDEANLLQRIQVIKGWTDQQGRTHQAVFDIAGNPPNAAAVDPLTCEVSGSGFPQLCASWQDPDFDPETAAVYYVRVLENPSCRWSHYDCLSLPEAQRPPSCRDASLPWQIQERAWTSPIWYTPGQHSNF